MVSPTKVGAQRTSETVENQKLLQVVCAIVLYVQYVRTCRYVSANRIFTLLVCIQTITLNTMLVYLTLYSDILIYYI
jgi:hypothetical protein